MLAFFDDLPVLLSPGAAVRPARQSPGAFPHLVLVDMSAAARAVACVALFARTSWAMGLAVSLSIPSDQVRS